MPKVRNSQRLVRFHGFFNTSVGINGAGLGNGKFEIRLLVRKVGPTHQHKDLIATDSRRGEPHPRTGPLFTSANLRLSDIQNGKSSVGRVSTCTSALKMVH